MRYVFVRAQGTVAGLLLILLGLALSALRRVWLHGRYSQRRYTWVLHVTARDVDEFRRNDSVQISRGAKRECK
jgi:hypothetical protein